MSNDEIKCDMKTEQFLSDFLLLFSNDFEVIHEVSVQLRKNCAGQLS